jgi:hypothetical protein
MEQLFAIWAGFKSAFTWFMLGQTLGQLLVLSPIIIFIPLSTTVVIKKNDHQ